MENWLKYTILIGALITASVNTSAQPLNGRGPGEQTHGATSANAAGQSVVLQPSGPIPGQFIVVFKGDVVDPRGLANALARQNGFALRGIYTSALKGFAAHMPEAVAERLATDPNVAYIEQDVYAHADIATGVDRIDAEQTAAYQTGSVAVDVAVIDTGIHPHPDLNIVQFYNCIGGCSGNGNPNNAFDDNGHGTHVSGTIGGAYTGVAPGARLWGLKVLDAGGSGSFADIISAIDLVTSNSTDIAIANMSLSGTGFLQSVTDALQASVNAGVVHVVAAGNASRDIYGGNGVRDTAAICKGLFCRNADDAIPAADPNVMAISAMADFDGMDGGFADQTITFSSCTHNGDDVFACFTNYSDHDPGANNPQRSDGNPVSSPGGAIDVAGPGVNIYSTWNNGGYNTISGTSMASPHVAGAVALYIQANGRASNAAEVANIRQAIIDAAQPQDQWGPADTKDPDGMGEGLVYAGGGGPALTHDIAVTSVIAPSAAELNSTLTVTVFLSNNGTQQETFTVNLLDSSPANIDPAQSVTLAAGASTSVDFSWTPTETGTHTLTASHDLSDDDITNDSNSATVSVAVPFNDMAVTSVTAPSPVERDIAQVVTVGLTNNGTQERTVAVSLEDDSGATISIPQDVTLAAGASTSVDFSWTPTQTGTHTLTARHDLSDDDITNDSSDTQVEVTEPVPSTVTVESVCYSGEGGRNADKHLVSTINLSDGSAPLSGATVSATVSDSSSSRSGTGTTDANGNVAFTWKNADSNETYTTRIDSVNGDTNVDTPPHQAAWPEDSGACYY